MGVSMIKMHPDAGVRHAMAWRAEYRREQTRLAARLVADPDDADLVAAYEAVCRFLVDADATVAWELSEYEAGR